jgi:hypothetical protein
MKTPPPEIVDKMDAATFFGRFAEGKEAAGIGGKGWIYTTRSGAHGVDYPYRAAIAQCCVGENLPQDAIYPSLSSDSEGRPLGGNNRYVLHFDEGELPPVDAFWSVTAYDIEGYFIADPLNRQAIGDRDKLSRQCRRLARHLHPGGLAREGEGGELAPGRESAVHAPHAPILPVRGSARGRLDAAAGRAAVTDRPD